MVRFYFVMDTVVESQGCVDFGTLFSQEELKAQSPEVKDEPKVEEVKKEEPKEEKEAVEEKRRITPSPTKEALFEENLFNALRAIAQRVKGVEATNEDLKKKIEESSKEINRNTTTSRKNYKQLIATLQKLIDEQFGDDTETDSDSDVEFKPKRKRK